jgi:hypothetical protein
LINKRIFGEEETTLVIVEELCETAIAVLEAVAVVAFFEVILAFLRVVETCFVAVESTCDMVELINFEIIAER